jgi:hypothetical protein
MTHINHYYGIEAWVVAPPFSAIIAILLLLGCDYLGLIFIHKIGFSAEERFSVYRMQAIIIGVMILAIILYPLALLHRTPLLLMQLLGWLLILLGCINSFKLFNKLKSSPKLIWENMQIVKYDNFVIFTALTIVILLFLIALGPSTNADALDYHLGVAIAILNQGGMPYIPEWFIGRLAGAGEVINALGLAVGAEQFGSLIQWASLISIIALVWPRIDAKDKQQIFSGQILVLGILSTPVLLFLISAPKPQLWPIAMTSLAFYLFATPSVEFISRAKLRAKFTLACMLCMCAAQTKFNYLLGGGIAGIFAFFVMVKQRDIFIGILISVFFAILIMLPPVLWKSYIYQASIFESFSNPLPGNFPGTEEAISLFSQNPDFVSLFPFPFSIILPSSLGSISVVLGLAWIFVFLYKPKTTILGWTASASVLSLVIINLFLAPPSARVYLEPLSWSLVLCAQAVRENRLIFPSYFGWAIKLQAIAFLIICCFGAITLFPGAINSTWRENIMYRSANGFELMRWVDEVLPKDAVLLNGHRSMALSPRKALSTGWTNYVDVSSNDALLYLNRIKEIDVTHILIDGDISPESSFYGCFGQVFAGPGPGKIATRNPFNNGVPHDAWLIEFNSVLLPGCAKTDSSPGFSELQLQVAPN